MLYFQYARGTYQDFQSLRRFHYCQGRPTLAAVHIVRCVQRTGASELAGVLVLSHPVPLCAERHAVFGTGGLPLLEKMRWANAHLRTISRVIVHPRYRGIGLARGLVERAAAGCPTRYLEARAHLGNAVPLFERAGFARAASAGAGRPGYFWREAGSGSELTLEPGLQRAVNGEGAARRR